MILTVYPNLSATPSDDPSIHYSAPVGVRDMPAVVFAIQRNVWRSERAGGACHQGFTHLGAKSPPQWPPTQTV